MRARDESDMRKQDHCAVICDMPADTIHHHVVRAGAEANAVTRTHTKAPLTSDTISCLESHCALLLTALSTSDIKAGSDAASFHSGLRANLMVK